MKPNFNTYFCAGLSKKRKVARFSALPKLSSCTFLHFLKDEPRAIWADSKLREVKFDNFAIQFFDGLEGLQACL